MIQKVCFVFFFLHLLVTMDVLLVESILTLYLLACQVRVTVSDSVLCLLLRLCDVFRALINSIVC